MDVHALTYRLIERIRNEACGHGYGDAQPVICLAKTSVTKGKGEFAGLYKGKTCLSAAATLAGIETAHMIRKGQILTSGVSGFQRFMDLAA